MFDEIIDFAPEFLAKVLAKMGLRRLADPLINVDILHIEPGEFTRIERKSIVYWKLERWIHRLKFGPFDETVYIE